MFLFMYWLALSPSLTLFPWPFFGSTPQPTPLIQTRFTLMVDPAGDARDAGREIDDTFERGITMQCAEELKKSLEAQIPGMRVILTRFPGETVEPLQNAGFANRLKVDLYLTLHFYEAKEKTPSLHLYHVLYNPGTDFWGKKEDELALLPYDQAYKLSIKKTAPLIKALYEQLKKDERKNNITCLAPLGIPFKPLAGIIAPAIALEIGIKKKDDWNKLVPLLVSALETTITTANVTHGISS